MSPLFFKKAKYVLIGVYLVSFAITIFSAFKLPVYVDEVQWKLTVSRYFLDGGKLIYLFPACDKGWLLSTPITWYPGRILDALLYGDASSPDKLRSYGWSIFMGLIFLWAWILYRLSDISKFNCLLFISSFFSLGMLPYLMVLNRPEQSLLLWTSLALGVSLVFSRSKLPTISMRLLITGLFILFGFLIASAHPKGIYFFPLLFFVFRNCEKSIFLGLVFISTLIISAYETISLWKIRTSCEESPWLTKLISQFTVQPELIFTNPAAFFDAGFNNLKRWHDYLDPIAFHADYQSQWFLGTPLVNQFPNFFWLIGYGVPYLLIAILFLLPFFNRVNYSFNFLYSLLKVNKQKLIYFSLPVFIAFILIVINRWQWSVVVLAYMITPMYSGKWIFSRLRNLSFSISKIQFGILIAIFLICFMQSLKNFYEASLLWPLLILFFIYGSPRLNLSVKRALIIYFLPIMLLLGIGYAITRVVITWDLPVMQFNSKRVHHLDSEKVKLFAKNQCGISDGSYPLVLDDKTYSIYWDRPFPLHISYVFGWWSTGTNPANTALKTQAEGLIITCESVSPEISRGFLKQDGLCCLSKEGLLSYR